MTRQLERLLTIDTLLRSPERHTTASIAEALEVSGRMISDLHRQANTLTD
ncbi:MAG: hypothetical protein AB4042_21995 [Leptolyngbyaceae cyanobacterium]